MTKQEHEEIAAIISQIVDERLTEPAQPPITAKLKSWLQEQGTQRGIVRILSAYLILQFNLDAELAVGIIGGAMGLIGLHDAVTRG